ncbi:MAG TPA: polymer-forming cytoskeletal protein [Pyrinomonadaceae bacterium]|nr:polymer-forming cytoskeletal protein [Pyrinomonadaceae bacterium]
MIYTSVRTNIFIDWNFPLRQTLGGIVFVLASCLTIFSQASFTVQPDEKTIIVEDAPEMEVFSFGKTVVVKKEAKGVFSFGGDVIIEGRVSGDVGTIGGTIIQKENAFIGGAVMAFGGSYKPESKNPLRNPNAETVMYAGYEEELRDLTQNPSRLFSPTYSWAFLAQRLLSVLFWFILTFAFTTIAPGAVSRAIARFRLSTLKVVAVGLSGFLVTTLGVMASLSFLPNYLSAIVSLMLFVFLSLSYVFGRIALQVSVGKQLQKRFLPENRQSETVAILIGVVFWTIFLSVPYIWMLALIILFSASIGLVLTARSANNWHKQ